MDDTMMINTTADDEHAVNQKSSEPEAREMDDLCDTANNVNDGGGGE